MLEINRLFSGIANVVKQADSTTKLFAIALLAGIAFLTVLAANETHGAFRLVVVGAALVIVLVTLVLASSLEKIRIVQGNIIYGTTISFLRQPSNKDYDAFISAPMETSLDGNGNVIGRDQIMDIRRHLEDVCRFNNIFYASADKTSKKDFDTNSVALSENFQALKTSRRHIFVFPESKPSSTLVEVGVALALGIPSFWFVKKGVKLPFLLEQAWQNSSLASELPKIVVHRYASTDDILRFISDHRDSCFH